MKYEFKGPGAPTTVDASTVVSEIERLKRRDGGVRPRAFWKEQVPEDAPLHDEFTWDDPTAADLYRDEQSRRIIRSVVLVSEPERHEAPLELRAYVSIHDPSAGTIHARVYQPTLEVLKSPQDTNAVKARMRREMLALQERYLAFLAADAAVNASVAGLVEALA